MMETREAKNHRMRRDEAKVESTTRVAENRENAWVVHNSLGCELNHKPGSPLMVKKAKCEKFSPKIFFEKIVHRDPGCAGCDLNHKPRSTRAGVWGGWEAKNTGQACITWDTKWPLTRGA